MFGVSAKKNIAPPNGFKTGIKDAKAYKNVLITWSITATPYKVSVQNEPYEFSHTLNKNSEIHIHETQKKLGCFMWNNLYLNFYHILINHLIKIQKHKEINP